MEEKKKLFGLEPEYKFNDFVVELSEDEDNNLVLSLIGNIENNAQSFLAEVLGKVDAALYNPGGSPRANVVLDFQEVAFCYSSGIKELINFTMKQVDRYPPDERIKVKFIGNKKATWQQTSLKAITFLARGVATIELIDPVSTVGI